MHLSEKLNLFLIIWFILDDINSTSIISLNKCENEKPSMWNSVTQCLGYPKSNFALYNSYNSKHYVPLNHKHHLDNSKISHQYLVDTNLSSAVLDKTTSIVTSIPLACIVFTISFRVLVIRRSIKVHSREKGTRKIRPLFLIKRENWLQQNNIHTQIIKLLQLFSPTKKYPS